ncbi:class I SAM-dependent methyltransferase [Ligilactobacillus aviarius]|uniref:DNA methyltransferase n=1 Tax=Ligilactobacillus aviarius TaxID=1606 RepID=A0A510WTJ7_9LACO|nr:class I SAM-dependent methyltransferase [Ligilactobacillus aviarius]KRM39717.1 adenine-specific methyltransferase [Ligilactobacillus aviarius subsp. aviarius DSM 20655]GEK42549.1 DNA methyltransferase [Ligilactobacillus aviarius]
MELKDIEQAYQTLSQIIEIFQKQLDLSYFDALIEALSDLLENQINGKEEIDASTVDELEKLYRHLDLSEFSSEEIRQVIQLLLLGSYKKERVQPNHQMTPDSIGYLITFLIEKITPKEKLNSMLDLTVGTGNLLAVILNNLKSLGNQSLKAYGVDNDDTLLAIADVSLALQRISNVELFHQDALDNLMLPQVDLVVSDLPVGYYPLDDRAAQFETHAAEGHSFAHYLLIERGIEKLAENGWGLFVVPSGIFETKEAQPLLKMIQKNGYLQGLLNLPRELFVSEKSRKAILMVQKKGGQAHQASQILLGDFPSLKDKKEFNGFLDEINAWVKENQ